MQKSNLFWKNFTFMTGNQLLNDGVIRLIQELSCCDEITKYVLFSEEYYYEAKQMSLTGEGKVFILIYSVNDLKFLDTTFIFNKIDARSTLVEWEVLLAGSLRTSRSQNDAVTPVFNRKDLMVIVYLINGVAIKNIAFTLQVNIKTLYNIKLSLFTKFSCNTRLDFIRLSRSNFFLKWLSFMLADKYISSGIHNKIDDSALKLLNEKSSKLI